MYIITHKTYLVFKKFVLECLVARIVARFFKQNTIFLQNQQSHRLSHMTVAILHVWLGLQFVQVLTYQVIGWKGMLQNLQHVCLFYLQFLYKMC